MSASRGVTSGSVYLIVIDGLPQAYTWQDLKDFVRPQAEHEFWADLSAVSIGTGVKRGCIRTQRTTEAWALYTFLERATVHGRRLMIVLWDIAQSPPKQLAPNPAQAMTATQARSFANGKASLQSVMPLQSAPQRPIAHPSATALAQEMEALSLHRQQQQAAYIIQQQQQQAGQQQQRSQAAWYASVKQQPPRCDTPQAVQGTPRTAPNYIQSYNGTPVNIRDGVALTVSRGIFVTGISFQARENDVKEKFAKAGEVVTCNLLTDAATGKSKGVATVLFPSSAEAQHAIERYNGTNWLGKKIKVRMDKEATTVAAPPRKDASPLIVNGSCVR